MSSYTEARHRAIGGGLYRIEAADGVGMWFYVGRPASGLGVLVPHGFVTDGPSIPPWLRWILRLLGIHNWIVACLLKPSAVHDRLREDPNFSLIESDCYFLVAMKADQKNWSGPAWAKFLLREVSFTLVRTNQSRASRNGELVQEVTS